MSCSFSLTLTPTLTNLESLSMIFKPVFLHAFLFCLCFFLLRNCCCHCLVYQTSTYHQLLLVLLCFSCLIVLYLFNCGDSIFYAPLSYTFANNRILTCLTSFCCVSVLHFPTSCPLTCLASFTFLSQLQISCLPPCLSPFFHTPNTNSVANPCLSYMYALHLCLVFFVFCCLVKIQKSRTFDISHTSKLYVNTYSLCYYCQYQSHVYSHGYSFLCIFHVLRSHATSNLTSLICCSIAC